MLDSLRNFTDRLLGRGSAAITVPVMDGALRPNRALDHAAVLAELPGINDLALGGVGHQELWASAGNVLYRLEGEHLVEQRRFDAPVTALAFSNGGQLAVALDGRAIQVLDLHGHAQQRLQQVDGQPLVAVNALAWEGEGALVFSEGSRQHGPADWCRDLMTLGTSGRALRWQLADQHTQVLAAGLAHACGVLPNADGAGGLLVAESWRHRVVLRGQAGQRLKPLVAELPGYPSRMAASEDGGFWLTCFVCRTQLVEFVLREPAYRERMVAEIAPQHWIAPALSSGNSFLEPLQGAGVKNMGVLKPWAPPRSYGLVLQVHADGRIRRSLHSQVDGRHHGVTAVAQQGRWLYVASQGSGRLLKVDLQQDHDQTTTGAQA
jgi:sugar lactone lactonase YvrE